MNLIGLDKTNITIESGHFISFHLAFLVDLASLQVVIFYQQALALIS